MNNQTNTGFVAGTLVHTDKGLVPIQDIKVGDRVLSKPEDGNGEPEYKPVLNTVVHQDKEIWLVQLQKSSELFDINDEMIDYEIYESASRYSEFLATPNHPIWVVGAMENLQEDIEFYDEPHFKRVDELQQYEIAVNNDGVMYTVERVQPIYKVANDKLEINPNHFWYQTHYHEDYYDDYKQDAEDYMLDYTEAEYEGVGYVKDIRSYEQHGYFGHNIEDKEGEIGILNQLADNQGDLIAYTTAVYNFEVADNHTYFVDNVGVWVHNINISDR